MAIVPMVGDGKTEPKRPMFVPLIPDPAGIAAFRYAISDDGRFALVDIVANHPRAFEARQSFGSEDISTQSGDISPSGD